VKTLKDLYVACGAEVAGEYVKIPTDLVPFDIVLTVYPTGIDHDVDGISVDLQVLLHDRITANKDGGVYHRDFNETLKLPIEAIKLAE
jgi:hypothetical protein